MKRRWVAMAILLAIQFGCNHPTQKSLAGSPILLRWELAENNYEGKAQNLSYLTIINNGDKAIENKGWTLCFNWCRRVLINRLPDFVSAEHINGDYYQLQPAKLFPVIAPGDSVRISLVGSHWVINATDAPLGFYFAWGKGESGEDFIVPSVEFKPVTDEQCKRYAADVMPVENAAVRYVKNQSVTVVTIDKNRPEVVPTPVQITYGDKIIQVPARWSIRSAENSPAVMNYFNEKLSEYAHLEFQFVNAKENTFIELSTDAAAFMGSSRRSGAYHLSVESQGRVHIIGYDDAGLFYGIRTFLNLLPLNPAADITECPVLNILDFPRFEYRGMHVDVARSFRSLPEMKKILDVMAMYKLNILHLHLSDDEGWRVEIPELPELTEVGAVRGHPGLKGDHLPPHLGSGPFTEAGISNGSGFYSREEFIELLQHAADRQIHIIPEFDFPGHARAAIVAMEVRSQRLTAVGHPEAAALFRLLDPGDTSQYESIQKFHQNVIDVGLESSYVFLETVVKSINEAYDAAGLTLTTFHIGGDEVPRGVWAGSPACQNVLFSHPEITDESDLMAWFVSRVYDILTAQNIQMAGWEDIAITREHGRIVPSPRFAGKSVMPYVWNSVWGWGMEDLGNRLANSGYQPVLANVTNLYLDMAYHKDPNEPGLYWGGFTDTKKTWEFTPFDVRNCVDLDLNGQPVDMNRFPDFQPLTNEGKKNIQGLQGLLWSENARTMDQFEYLVFPKLLGMAERAWSLLPDWELQPDEPAKSADWNRFVNVLGQQELPRLDQLNIHYRIPLPGACILNDTLHANIRFPGLTIRYTLDGSVPTLKSTQYAGPVAEINSPVVKLSAFDSTGRSSRVVSLLNIE